MEANPPPPSKIQIGEYSRGEKVEGANELFSYRGRVAVISVLHWFILCLIPASFILSAAYVVVGKDFDINAPTPGFDSASRDSDELDPVRPSEEEIGPVATSTSSWLTPFEQEYFGYFSKLCGNGGAGSDAKLFMFSAGYFALIYLTMQCILGAKLMQGERDLHYWKLQAWYEGQLGILLVSVYLNLCILGQQDDSGTSSSSRRLSSALMVLALFTYISHFVMIWTVYQFMEEVKLKGVVYPEDGKKKQVEKSTLVESQFTKDLRATLDWLKNAQVKNVGLHPVVCRCNVIAVYFLEKLVKFGARMDESGQPGR